MATADEPTRPYYFHVLEPITDTRETATGTITDQYEPGLNYICRAGETWDRLHAQCEVWVAEGRAALGTPQETNEPAARMFGTGVQG